MDNSKSPVSSALPPPSKNHFPLLRPPKDLRLMIDEACLVPPNKPILRSKEEIMLLSRLDCHYRLWHIHGPNIFIRDLVEVSLLQVSRLIHNEAMPIFYAKNKFYYSISRHSVDKPGRDRSLSDRSTPFSRHFDKMSYISLGLYQPISEKWPLTFDTTAEMVLSRFLKEIDERCGSALKTLSIQHVFTKYEDKPTLLANGPTAMILRQMIPHLKSLTLVRFKWWE